MMTAERVTVPIAALIAMTTLLQPVCEGQDLSRYRTHEPIHIELLDKNREQKEAEARRFLWESWSYRNRAHLVQTTYSKEGERSSMETFIEPNYGVVAIRGAPGTPSRSRPEDYSPLRDQAGVIDSGMRGLIVRLISKANGSTGLDGR
jgi:hypothetical protein